MVEHDWETVQQFSMYRRCKCTRCGAGRIYEWQPGWPGSSTYLDADGNRLTSEPSCRGLPDVADLMAGIGDEDNWTVAEGFPPLPTSQKGGT